RPEAAMQALSLATHRHFVMNLLLGTKEGPVWLVDGISDYFALSPVDDAGRPLLGQLSIKADRRDFSLMSLLNRDAGRLQVTDLLKGKAGPNFNDHQSRDDRLTESTLLMEGAAWSFVHFLLNGDVSGGKEYLFESIRRARKGEQPDPAPALQAPSGSAE